MVLRTGRGQGKSRDETFNVRPFAVRRSPFTVRRFTPSRRHADTPAFWLLTPEWIHAKIVINGG
jgi:hypothetical protein